MEVFEWKPLSFGFFSLLNSLMTLSQHRITPSNNVLDALNSPNSAISRINLSFSLSIQGAIALAVVVAVVMDVFSQ